MTAAAAILIAAAATVGPLGCGGGDEIPEPTGVPEQTRRVSLFYSTGRTLVEEVRIVDASQDVYVTVLEKLLEATPETNTDIAIVQPETKPVSVALGEDGVVVIDWGADILGFEATDEEKVLALAAILRTFGQFDEVKKVKFTVEGKTEGTAGGKDIQAFWDRISLIGQPWDVLRAPEEPGSDEATPSAETSATANGPAPPDTSSTTEP